jgi:hypothetical protein
MAVPRKRPHTGNRLVLIAVENQNLHGLAPLLNVYEHRQREFTEKKPDRVDRALPYRDGAAYSMTAPGSPVFYQFDCGERSKLTVHVAMTRLGDL